MSSPMMNELTKFQLLLQQVAAAAMLLGAALFMLWPLWGTIAFTACSVASRCCALPAA